MDVCVCVCERSEVPQPRTCPWVWTYPLLGIGTEKKIESIENDLRSMEFHTHMLITHIILRNVLYIHYQQS